ncbi:putative secreted protein (Por secretion system target) [Marinoscillum furvescens DSM 4134]|uniref:Putative secreted protein (Por secretion system target) n=2 Tax=Marinoscillum furvescens TaxID=1026 RepID=A0A3D9L5I9_MARFU|nr:putative secreted protein (Por secretion system target) [Marinoscillum furvescens DSM 4134]
MRTLYGSMNTKLIIASLVILFSFSASAQGGDDGSVVSAENNFYNQSLNTNNKIEIYPNPAVDFIVVKIENSTLENTEFELHSIIGNEMTITPEDMGNGQYRVPVKDFATGYYFLVVKDEVTRFKKAYRFLKN